MKPFCYIVNIEVDTGTIQILRKQVFGLFWPTHPLWTDGKQKFTFSEPNHPVQWLGIFESSLIYLQKVARHLWNLFLIRQPDLQIQHEKIKPEQWKNLSGNFWCKIWNHFGTFCQKNYYLLWLLLSFLMLQMFLESKLEELRMWPVWPDVADGDHWNFTKFVLVTWCHFYAFD